MKPILYSENENQFISRGLGTLTDAISCTVTEQRNGSYELKMDYPVTGIHFSDIAQRSIVLAKPNYYDDPQPFRIYKITKPLNGKCSIYAEHISYDLTGFPVEPFTAQNLAAALSGLKANAKVDIPFTFTTDKSVSTGFAVDVPSSIRSWMGGKQGSLLDIYGGEWHYDRYTCTLMNNRGSDKGYEIRYGKNLVTLEQEESCSNLCTGIWGYYVDEDGLVTSGDIINTGYISDIKRIKPLDLSDAYESTPTKAQINTRVENYIRNNNVGVPDVNLKLNYAQLQGMDRIDLCDTVHIYFEQLGVNETAKCIETVWDVLIERYISCSFGRPKVNIADTINTIQKDTAEKPSFSWIEKAINYATNLITGNLGGYLVQRDSDEDGFPDELLMMDTPDITTATNVWRWNQYGLGFSSTGYEGPYSTAITADGQIVGDFITAGTINADNVEIINLKASNVNLGDTSTTVEQAMSDQLTIITEHSSELLVQSDEIASKVTQAEFIDLEGRVVSTETNLADITEQQEAALQNLGEQFSNMLSDLQQIVEQNSTAIEQTGTAIELLASKELIDSLNEQINELSARLEVTAGSIAGYLGNDGQITAWFQFTDGQITIGKSDSPIKAIQDNANYKYVDDAGNELLLINTNGVTADTFNTDGQIKLMNGDIGQWAIRKGSAISGIGINFDIVWIGG